MEFGTTHSPKIIKTLCEQYEIWDLLRNSVQNCPKMRKTINHSTCTQKLKLRFALSTPWIQNSTLKIWKRTYCGTRSRTPGAPNSPPTSEEPKEAASPTRRNEEAGGAPASNPSRLTRRAQSPWPWPQRPTPRGSQSARRRSTTSARSGTWPWRPSRPGNDANLKTTKRIDHNSWKWATLKNPKTIFGRNKSFGLKKRFGKITCGVNLSLSLSQTNRMTCRKRYRLHLCSKTDLHNGKC